MNAIMLKKAILLFIQNDYGNEYQMCADILVLTLLVLLVFTY